MAGVNGDRGFGFFDLGAGNLGNALFMNRIHMRENCHDANRVDLVLDQCLDRLHNVFFIKRNDHIAELIDALGHTMGALARHQRIRVMMCDSVQSVGIRIVRPGLQAAPHQDHVFKALGGDEAQSFAGARQ